jgi:isopentenyl diphosphate isomerase/L-lactate dehydrogenase-like FMN-dependent dehydrogenase
MNAPDETVESERTRAQELARSLVEEAWNLGCDPMLLTVQHEGAIRQVSVKVVQRED